MMDPSDESLHSDLTLSIPKAFKSVVMSLNEGDLTLRRKVLRLEGALLIKCALTPAPQSVPASPGGG